MVAATPLASGSDQHPALPSKIEKPKTQSGPQRGRHVRICAGGAAGNCCPYRDQSIRLRKKILDENQRKRAAKN